MAKRARGSTSRPGQRPPLQRQAARPVAPSTAVVRSDELTTAEEARAAELEAAIVADERKADDNSRRARSARAARAASADTQGATSGLAISAADEYAYVARDIRRIVVVGGSLVAILFGAWAIATVTGIGPF